MRPVLLVSPPWALFNRPSIQIGTLKAFLHHTFPKLHVRAEHLHLQAAAQIGFTVYQAVSERTWTAESIAATLLYPEQRPAIEQLFKREIRHAPEIGKVGLKQLSEGLDLIVDRFVLGIDWANLGLAGISVSLCQMTTSLLLIQRIKRRCPSLPVVVGGSTFSGERPENLTAVFPEIDHLVQGEGETALAELVEHYCRDNGSSRSTLAGFSGRSLIADLDQLPRPDYDDYFELLQSLPQEERFFPVLPVEASRGCWWQARTKRGQGLPSSGRPKPGWPPNEDIDADHSKGCTFCNLNLQWRGYRNKSPNKIAQEIDELTSRHQVLSVAFMDNLLPRKGHFELFAKLIGTGKNYKLFAEIRADTPRAMLQSMYLAGVRELQVGIEALSTKLLRKMNKGVTALRNIEMMRHCEAMGIRHGGNLMLCFPGSTDQEASETLRNIQRVRIYRPLKPVGFWLGLDSPVCRNFADFGIQRIGNHARWFAMFPERIARRLRFLVQGYRGDRARQRRIWAPVAAMVRSWEQEYTVLMRDNFGRGTCGPVLGYQDGRDFLLIIQRRVGLPNILHRLNAPSREVYLYCRTNRSRQRIQAAFPALPSDKLDGFLRMMADKGLMLGEAERFLSLAVPMEPGLERLEQ